MPRVFVTYKGYEYRRAVWFIAGENSLFEELRAEIRYLDFLKLLLEHLNT